MLCLNIILSDYCICVNQIVVNFYIHHYSIYLRVSGSVQIVVLKMLRGVHVKAEGEHSVNMYPVMRRKKCQRKKVRGKFNS